MSFTSSVIHEGDVRAVLPTLPAGSVHTCVTSPPYFALRDYGTGSWEGGDPGCDHRVPRHPNARNIALNERMGRKSGQKKHEEAHEQQYEGRCARCGAVRVGDTQIGLEPTPEAFVENLVAVFREVRRVLRDDGTIWVNLGDSYNAYNGNRGASSNGVDTRRAAKDPGVAGGSGLRVPSLKQKDLIGTPWMLAFALRADGWYLRSDIVWHKPNPMPESVVDRPTRSHEFIFLLSKGPRYYYDADAIREPLAPSTLTTFGTKRNGVADEPFVKANRIGATMPERKPRLNADGSIAGANKRDVWTVGSQPYDGAHFATFPEALIRPCILAGAPERACEACGAPWRRVTERVETGHDGSRYGERAVEATGGAISGGTARSTLGSSNGHGTAKRQTVGWEPNCSCDAGTVPGVVLDPFSGAATTGLVAARLGRSYVGVELNPEYAALGRDRIAHVVNQGVLPL